MCTQAHNDFFFHTANQTVDSPHNDHSAVCTTFHNCIDLKTSVQLMVCVHVTSSVNGRGMQSLLETATNIRCAYLYHTHMHMALCMYTCSCMPTTLSPSPSLSPPSHTMPQRMYASVPRCIPIARLGLIHTCNTMPSHIQTPSPKALSMCGCMVWHACVCAYHKGQIESLHLSTRCQRMHIQ